MAGISADVGLRRRRGLDHFDEWRRRDGGEIRRRFAHVLIGDGASDRPHARFLAPRAALEVRHLPDDVFGRHAREVGRFWVPLPRHQMARSARVRHRAGSPVPGDG